MKRTGLKRLECLEQCGCAAYMTLAQLERHGMPSCPCGSRMVPEDLEVAAAVLERSDLETVPAYREFVRECESLTIGQRSHQQRGRKVSQTEAVATERVAKAAQQSARARRLSGLVQFNQAATAAAMPF